MQYRKFGRTDFQVSALGFGAMRLPVTTGGNIDENEAIKIIRYGIDHGINYIDTAYNYHDGAGEGLVGRALKEGYRDRVKVATKLPSWLVKSAADFDRYLNEQLQRLEMDYIDFYLLHTLNKNHWTRLRDLGVLEWAEKAIAGGRFRYLGFSFHDDIATFKQIVDAYDWSMCQIQYNYMDVDKQAGVEGLRYAAQKGIAVVIMEPLLGGNLAEPPAVIQSIWNQAPRQRTAVDWALQWLWNQPEISTVLSGMSTMEQVIENVASAAVSGVDTLTLKELDLVKQVRAGYEAMNVIPCTGCGYCMPCPNNVNIPDHFAHYNSGIKYDRPEAARRKYKLQPHGIRALQCTSCGECEAQCPQAIPVSKWMPVIHAVLDEGKPFVNKLDYK